MALTLLSCVTDALDDRAHQLEKRLTQGNGQQNITRKIISVYNSLHPRRKVGRGLTTAKSLCTWWNRYQLRETADSHQNAVNDRTMDDQTQAACSSAKQIDDETAPWTITRQTRATVY